MSTPHEASLTEKERAILAGLAAQAEADDPSLAATLRGRARRVSGASATVTRHFQVPGIVAHWGWGVALGVAGLAVMLVSLSTVLAVGFVGMVMVFAGVYRVAVARPRPVRAGPATRSAPATSDN